MAKIKIFNDGNRYNVSLLNTQDYYLWVDLIAAGNTFSNINKPLLYFRKNSSFYKRRGFKKVFNDIRCRLYAMQKLNCFSLKNLFYLVSLVIIRIAPSKLKKLAYHFFR
ncbi:MAG: hypothetical protein HAW67_08500 [Endozoicomonadaceae bacterium]|nr:hypothetical protein [Endozoicomonadaceae bacterium]